MGAMDTERICLLVYLPLFIKLITYVLFACLFIYSGVPFCHFIQLAGGPG